MKNQISHSSFKNGEKFIKVNGNKKIEGIKEKLETLKEIDRVRNSMPTVTSNQIGVLIST
jgi:hypothetical protein